MSITTSVFTNLIQLSGLVMVNVQNLCLCCVGGGGGGFIVNFPKKFSFCSYQVRPG